MMYVDTYQNDLIPSVRRHLLQVVQELVYASGPVDGLKSTTSVSVKQGIVNPRIKQAVDASCPRLHVDRRHDVRAELAAPCRDGANLHDLVAGLEPRRRQVVEDHHHLGGLFVYILLRYHQPRSGWLAPSKQAESLHVMRVAPYRYLLKKFNNLDI